MTLEAWRIVKTKFARTAFDGEGARLYGGRWNSPGRPMIYTSGSISLATLEILVHLGTEAILDTYSVIRVRFDEALIQEVAIGDLPGDWRADPPPPDLQLLGDRWLDQNRSVGLRVPSSVVPREFNYLFNPAHPRFTDLQIDEPRKVEFDERLRRPTQ